MNNRKTYSWGIIVLLFIVFFPVGIALMIQKVSAEKLNYINNGKALVYFGYVLIPLGLIYLLMGLTNFRESFSSLIPVICLFCAGGTVMIIKGKEYIKLGNKYARYVELVNSQDDIYNIAAAYPTQYETACKDLQQMICTGYFQNCKLDLSNHKITFAKTPDYISGNAVEKEPVIVKCPGCGAVNKIIPGSAGECEYCGTPLK